MTITHIPFTDALNAGDNSSSVWTPRLLQKWWAKLGEFREGHGIHEYMTLLEKSEVFCHDGLPYVACSNAHVGTASAWFIDFAGCAPACLDPDVLRMVSVEASRYFHTTVDTPCLLKHASRTSGGTVKCPTANLTRLTSWTLNEPSYSLQAKLTTTIPRNVLIATLDYLYDEGYDPAYTLAAHLWAEVLAEESNGSAYLTEVKVRTGQITVTSCLCFVADGGRLILTSTSNSGGLNARSETDALALSLRVLHDTEDCTAHSVVLNVPKFEDNEGAGSNLTLYRNELATDYLYTQGLFVPHVITEKFYSERLQSWC